MGLADLLDSVGTDDNQITPHYLEWLNGDRVYSDAAIAFAQDQFAGNYMTGPKAFRASESGMCRRRRLLTRYGPPPPPPTPGLQNIFDTGTMLHLKWQMAGLTQGWLVAAETHFYYPEHQPIVRGKVDGETSWDGLFEYKSAGEWDMRKVRQRGEPLPNHHAQAAVAMVALDKARMNIVYEEKSTGEWVEFVIERTPDLDEFVADDVDNIAALRDDEVVPPMLPRCQAREGEQYSRCPQREHCPMAEILIDWTRP